jgi:hypothetical protein
LPYLDEVRAHLLEPLDDAVQGGLVHDDPREDRLVAVLAHRKTGELGDRGGVQVPAHPELVRGWLHTASVWSCSLVSATVAETRPPDVTPAG